MFSFITKPIGCLFSLIGSLVVIAIVLVALSLGLVAYFMPQIGAKAITEATGFPTSVGSSSLSLWNQRLSLENIRIDNPEESPERDFISIPSFVFTLDRKASDKEHLVFSDVTLHIDTLTLVRLPGNTLNSRTLLQNLLLSALSAASPQPQSATPAARQSTALPANALPQEGRLLSAQEAQMLIARNQAAAAGQPATGYAPVSQGSGAIQFEPLVQPVTTTESPFTAQGNATAAPRPPWLIRRLTISIDTIRLFETTPQGNILQLRPLNFKRTFEDVTTLKNVLPHLPL